MLDRRFGECYLFTPRWDASVPQLMNDIAVLDLLFVQINEQIGTADDAMEDWRDIVPDEVAELERRGRERKEKGI